MPLTITANDRQALYDRLMRYARAMDSGDAAGVAACFTPDGVLTNAAGDRFEGRAGVERFAATAMRNKTFRGRQHHIRPLLLQSTGSSYRACSYYQVVDFQAGRDPSVLSLGWYADDMVRDPQGGWLIKAKKLNRWNTELDPRAGALGPAPVVRTVGLGRPIPGQPDVADRLAMEDLMHVYAAALDIGDVPAMQAAFHPDATLESGALGALKGPDGIRTFLANATKQPGFAGRQHRIFPLTFERDGDGWRAFSYWKVETWTAGQTPRLVGLGYYDDRFRKGPAGWRFASKAIRRWSSDNAPMSPAFERLTALEARNVDAG